MERKERAYLQHYLSTAKERKQTVNQSQSFKKVRKLQQGEEIKLYDKVKLLNLTDHLILNVMIVPDHEVNLFEGKWGETSELGHPILEGSVLTTFECQEIEYKILSVSGMRG